MIRDLDRNRFIRCTDISAPAFDARAKGLDAVALNQQIHARLNDGQIVTGVEVFRQIYGRLGFRRWVAWSRNPWLSKFLDWSYSIFAKHRRRIGQPFRLMQRLLTKSNRTHSET